MRRWRSKNEPAKKYILIADYFVDPIAP